MKKRCMEKQEVFDRIANHLLFQGRKSKEGGTCLYWDQKNGLKCAVGCMIPESEYDPEIEKKSVNNPIILMRLPFYTQGMIDLLAALQRIHDEKDPEDWESELKDISDKYNLAWPPEHPERGLEGLAL